MRICIRFKCSVAQVRANQKQLNLSWEVDKSVPEHLVGDAGRLQQCLINLGNSSELLLHVVQLTSLFMFFFVCLSTILDW